VHFRKMLRERLGQFGLMLHPDKTRLLEFGRFATQDRQARGRGKPETFQFLGFVHACEHTRTGWFVVHRHTAADRLRAKLAEVKDELRRRRHAPIPEVGKYLAAVVRGQAQYYGIKGNSKAIQRFHREVGRLWQRALSRRSQKGAVRWERMQALLDRWLPPPRIAHPSAEKVFAVMTQGRSPVQ